MESLRESSGFAFKARGRSEPGAFAELGFEENGVFLD